MLYHLSEYLVQAFEAAGPLRLVRYISFRTIVAMLTSFLITLLIGRTVINFLYRRKIRDVVRDYSVMSVESKKGTPTMGGILMILAILASIALWGNFRSPFLYYLLFAMFWFAAVGGIDDYFKIRNQNSDAGLSRKAKYLSQISYGLIFGFFFLYSGTTPLPHPTKQSGCRVKTWKSKECDKPCKTNADCATNTCGVTGAVCMQGRCAPPAACSADAQSKACRSDEACIASCGSGAYCPKHWEYPVPGNKVLVFRPSQLYIPFYKFPLMDLSWLYIFVIVFMIVYAANAVNFADGLDGLATGPTLFSYLVFGIYAYFLGNMLTARYLWYPFLPGAGETAVFCGAVVGALVGFLWFNTYPAEIFMGDTGSITLGGILGTVMVLLKQEFLFFLLGGVFLAELLSVAVQDWLGIQVLGRRIFYRAPIHHTFQHRGLSEPKIVVRFWIVSAMLALLSLAALKIR
ncbi:MAG: phospho-N-acetylmuramoyl-pentapeptide-transferase [Myxococcales bacterium]|nr:phospho-N-acetylmuramoyl-pentapeptide-transferase [Myxococcales bacterium]MCB9642901.1 phospho-N-acetylmuramoyl-pentapeptide-transferase [Myxococcales bacterium]